MKSIHLVWKMDFEESLICHLDVDIILINSTISEIRIIARLRDEPSRAAVGRVTRAAVCDTTHGEAELEAPTRGNYPPSPHAAGCRTVGIAGDYH